MSKKKGGETPADSKEQEQFTYEDFDNGTVFKFLSEIKDPYDQDMALRRLEKLAAQLKFPRFKSSFRKYQDKQREQLMPTVVESGFSDFAGQSVELNTGEWIADEHGVRRYGGGGNEIWACDHPIMPVRIMRSIDTKTIKYTLAWRYLSDEWEFMDVDAEVLSQATKIVAELSKYGISVSTGERANNLVDYLREMISKNKDVIRKVKSVSRMGWNEDGFSPYVSGVEFDSATTFNAIYKSITPTGSLDEWLAEARDARTYSTTAKIVLAASFAAPLIEPLGILPFFVHLWSTASGTGKSVGQMLGASVWANPTPGGAFFPTFRSTSVGIEMISGFLHSMPLFIDELQLAKDKNGKVQFNVYELASGSGKLRSNKSLGLNYTPKWDIVFITSGETPIVKETDGEGALNRVLEIECYADNKVIRDGHRTANALKANYGWAGKMFIEKLMEDVDREHLMESVKTKIAPIYEDFYLQCTKSDTTEKQAMAAAAILTADKLATDWIIQDGNALTLKEIGEYLKTKERVSLMQRGYDAICDWVYIYANKFHGYQDGDSKDVYGVIEDNVAYMFRSAFDKACVENALEPKAMLSHLKSRKLIATSTKGYTKNKRFGKFGSIPCICLRLQNDNEEAEKQDEIADLPV